MALQHNVQNLLHYKKALLPYGEATLNDMQYSEKSFDYLEIICIF